MYQPTRRVALIGALLIAGLPVAFVAESMTRATGSSTLTRDDAQFVQKAAQVDMLKIRATEIAFSRALTRPTREFASAMAMAHGASHDGLQGLAVSKRVTLPTRLTRHHRKMLEKLQEQKSMGFDKQYAEIMREAHRETIDLFAETAKDSKDADVRAFATSTLLTLQHHLDTAKQLVATN